MLRTASGLAKLGEKVLKDGDAGKSLKYFSKAVKKSPKNFQHWVGLGRAHLATADFDSAYDAFGTAVNLNPGDFDSLYERARTAEEVGEFQQALQDWNELVVTHADNPKSWIGRARHACTYCFDSIAAERDALLAKECSIQDRDANVVLASIYCDAGQFETSLKVLNDMERMDPSDKWARVSKAQVLFAMRRHAEAAHEFGDLLAWSDEEFAAHIDYVRSLLYCESVSLALPEIKYLETKMPSSGGPPTLNAIALLIAGNTDEAIKELREAEKLFHFALSKEDNQFIAAVHRYNVAWFSATRAYLNEEHDLNLKSPEEDRESSVNYMVASLEHSYANVPTALATPEMDFIWGHSKIVTAMKPFHESVSRLQHKD